MKIRRNSALLLLPLLILSFLSASGANPPQNLWVGTWASSPQLGDAGNAPPAACSANCTLRQIVHVSAGGSWLRVRFSNAFGRTPLTITSAHIALAGSGSEILPQSDRELTFSHSATVTVPAGAPIYSDPIQFHLPALTSLAITIHLDSMPDGVTVHPGARATSYLQPGNEVSAPALPNALRVDHWYFVNGVDAKMSCGGAVAVLGDSITDGRGSITNGNGRWTDYLAKRLQANPADASVGVLNEGIGGNRLLHDGLGPNALARLDRDVLAQDGVHWLIVLEGVNDIGTAAQARLHHETPASAEDIIKAYQQIIARAHIHHILVYGATITPFGRSFYDSPAAEAKREAVNRWIRTSGEFDAVIDMSAVVRDNQPLPSHASPRLSPALDSGDHLHPNDAGYRAMGGAVDLHLFEQAGQIDKCDQAATAPAASH